MSIILGGSYAKVELVGGRIPIVTFPLTNLNGRQIENYEPEGYEVKTTNCEVTPGLIRRPIISLILGYYITWTFNYPDFIDGDDLINFGEIFRNIIGQTDYTLRLTPRVDQENRFFDCYCPLNPFAVGVSTGGSNAQFNKDAVFVLKTKDFVTDFKWQITVPPDLRTYVVSDGIERILGV